MKVNFFLYSVVVFFVLFQTHAMEYPKIEGSLKSLIIEFEGENDEITLTGESLAAFKNVCENSTIFKDLIPDIEKGFFKERNRVYLSNISKDQFCLLLSIFKNMREYPGNYFASGFQTKKIADLIKILEPLDFLQAPCYQDVMELIAYRLLDNPALAKKHLESLYNQDLVNTPTTIIFPDGSNIDFTSKKELVDLYFSSTILSGNISTTTITISPKKRILYYLKNLTKKNFIAKFGKVTDTENKKRLLIDYSPLKVEVLKKKLLKLSSCKMSCWIDTCIATESLLRNKLSTIVYKNTEMPLFNEHSFSEQFNLDNYNFAILDGHEIHIYKTIPQWIALYNSIQKTESLAELLEILAKRG